jgi:hypothetical protein
VGFVPKPFKFDDLIQFVKNKLNIKKSGLKSPAGVRSAKRLSGLQSPFDIPKSA